MRKRGFSMEQKKARWGWIFVTPALILFSIFSFYPIFTAFYTSFYNKNLLSLRPPRYIGWANYQYLFTSQEFRESVINTAVFTAGTFVSGIQFNLGGVYHVHQ